MYLEKIANDYIIQPRSRYQIENFVVGQHDTLEMQYRQILIEAQELIYKIKMAEINQKKILIQIDRLLKTGDELDALEAEEKQLSLQRTEIVLEGSRRELKILENLFNNSKKYSPEDIEDNQQEYWKLRLSRQAEMDKIQAIEGVSVSNLEALLQAGLLYKQTEIDSQDIREIEHN